MYQISNYRLIASKNKDQQGPAEIGFFLIYLQAQKNNFFNKP